jgi:putative flippase GtrA
VKIPKSLLRYGTVGLLSNASLYVVFVGLIWAGLSAPLTAAVCYGLGLSISYVMNRAWSFESNASHARDLPRFLICYGVGFVATMIFIVILTRWMRPEIAQILNIGLTAIVIYGLLRVTGFGKDQVAKND